MKTKKPRKEALFVQVPSPDGTVEFHDATSHIGKSMPFKNPKATCGMRVHDEVVAFSLLHLTKKTATSMAEKELLIPRGPLTRVEKRAEELAAEIGDDELIIESDAGTQRCRIVREANGIAELEPIGEDVNFELPREAVKISMYTKNPTLGRLVAVGFIGHPGRPGSPETLRRVASMALFSLTQLSAFRVITGMVSVVVPAAPRAVIAVATRKTEDKVQLDMPVWLFEDSNPPTLVKQGQVFIEIDLDLANPATGKLLYHFTPNAEIAEIFETYRPILDSTVTEVLRGKLDDSEINTIAIEIVLGEVGSGTVGRLREALEGLANGLDLTPRQRQFHS
jgi:hypothetical protein